MEENFDLGIHYMLYVNKHIQNVNLIAQFMKFDNKYEKFSNQNYSTKRYICMYAFGLSSIISRTMCIKLFRILVFCFYFSFDIYLVVRFYGFCFDMRLNISIETKQKNNRARVRLNNNHNNEAN